jgi:hypothetical protein
MLVVLELLVKVTQVVMVQLTVQHLMLTVAVVVLVKQVQMEPSLEQVMVETVLHLP